MAHFVIVGIETGSMLQAENCRNDFSIIAKSVNSLAEQRGHKVLQISGSWAVDRLASG